MKHIAILLACGIMLTACAPRPADAPVTAKTASAAPDAAPPTATPPARPENPAVEDTCGKAQYASFVGKPETAAGVPAAGAGVRHIGPKTQVTMDFRPDRLNIYIDDKGVITEFKCG